MIVQRRMPVRRLLNIALPNVLLAGLWAAGVYVAYANFGLDFVRIPFLPISTVGTAVAFYVGFKNNSAYSRFWEARKIWGGVVNLSRSWATLVRALVRSSEGEHRTLILRHLAWVNALRFQLRRTSYLTVHGNWNERRRIRRHAAAGAFREGWDAGVWARLPEAEVHVAAERNNRAAHIVDLQGQHLRGLHERGELGAFERVTLLRCLEECYALQGKCERIKNTPLPRQYAELSRVLTAVFLFMLPFGLLDVFGVARGSTSIVTVVVMSLCAGVVATVFIAMEQVGEMSEDPFERSMADVPLNALCRTIERDLSFFVEPGAAPATEPSYDGVVY